MYKASETTQFFKILKMLDSKKGGYTIEEIAERTGYPLPSLRRTLADMRKVYPLEKVSMYRLK